MKELNVTEISQISGGCAEHCWGDFDIGGLSASMAGGAIAGSVGGPVGAFAGAIGGGIAYSLSIVWSDK